MRIGIIVAALTIAGCRRAPPGHDTPSTATSTSRAAPIASASPTRSTAGVSAPRAETGSQGPSWSFASLSRDGKRALLSGQYKPRLVHLRIVDVDTGATLEEARLDVLSELRTEFLTEYGSPWRSVEPVLQSPDLAADLVRGAKLVKGFPLGAARRFAASADGSWIAFQAADFIYVADGHGTVRKRAANDVAYDPWFSQDGLLIRRRNGMIGRVDARYELFVAPLDDSSTARRIVGTSEVREGFAVAADGKTVRVVASNEPHVKTCVVSVGLIPPFAAKSLACLAGQERLSAAVLSPTGAWAAFETTKELAEENPNVTMVEPDGTRRRAKKLARRLRVVHVDDANVAIDLTGLDESPHAISDEGLVVLTNLGREIIVRDAIRASHRALSEKRFIGYRGSFRSPRELVYLAGSDVGVLKLPPN